MPIAAVTSVLAAGLLPLFKEETAPQTTQGAAQVWANAYVAYTLAGGVLGGEAKKVSLAADLADAFSPEKAGAGPFFWLKAMTSFWATLQALGMTTGSVLGTAVFTSSSPSISGNQSPSATPEQQANSLAGVVASITLSSVIVTTPVPVIVSPIL